MADNNHDHMYDSDGLGYNKGQNKQVYRKF